MNENKYMLNYCNIFRLFKANSFKFFGFTKLSMIFARTRNSETWYNVMRYSEMRSSEMRCSEMRCSEMRCSEMRCSETRYSELCCREEVMF